ncbi:MAG TPA: hypothetical protein VNO30_46050 [Kofleriaceae bacterium]|nr:hypothetical protein [Kofleriaceae bacterium]
MATDLVRARRVAWLVIAAGAAVAAGAGTGCRPAIRPDKPGDEPGPVARLEQPRPKVTGGRQIVVGEMCPQAAGGRPAVAPLVMRSATWVDAQADLAYIVERGMVPRFTVFGVDGKVAGVFETVGLMDLGIAQQVAAGTYVGGMPCTADAGGGQRVEDPKCAPATGGCGIAVGEIARPDDLPPTPVFQTGGACVAGEALAVDLDGDGTPEQFPLAALLDGGRSPAAEWSAAPAPAAAGACRPSFELYDVRLTPVVEPGKPIDPKHTVGLDVLAVADLDGDGRKELVLALKFPTVRTIAVYTAPDSAQRLELAGEGQSFPR